MAFKFTKLGIADVLLIEGEKFSDERGFFMETYKQSEFMAKGIKAEFPQDNFSSSKKNVLRGLHYQLPPFAQSKLVRVLQGKILDVAVDIRKNSPTFKQAVAVELSADKSQMLFIPEGFAHGFLVLSDSAEVLYKASSEYNSNSERGLRWDDPELNINWKVIDRPMLSSKDQTYPSLSQAELFE